ncbi:DMT family transporter [Vibrio sp. SCSIO 43136]|uniref:DMT family transporter n=1 Tax=Vibrio sp. SCSIO 43136 TaxID=2819101 RepID=UPI0020764217|nr:DMT family transporter [Vibrio sp. SCSIO 43136]USD67449.1 DMT family transporter [Vibrio sp. SCSIO 43136]
MSAPIATSSTPTSQIQQGVVFALLGTALFSIKPVLIKLAYALGGDATSIMSLRALSSLPVYLVILVWLCRDLDNRKLTVRYGWQAATVGVLGYYFASLLDIMALEHISAQLERLLIFLFPSFVVLISWVFLKEKATKSTLLSIGLGYFGVALIVSHDFKQLGGNVLFGSGLAVASALTFAVYLILSKQLINKLGSSLFTSIGMGSAGVAIVIQHFWMQADFSSMSNELILLGIAIGIFCTVLPSYFVAAAMARLTPTMVGVTSNIGPVVTSIFAVTLLGEVFTVYHAIGMVLVVYAVVGIKSR